MSETPFPDVISHWHKLVENFSTSSREFYSSVESALDRRQIPGIKLSRVNWREGGVLSPEREYLRVSSDRHSFDICAAPFGTGFFFSSWLTALRPSALLAFLAVLSLTCLGWYTLVIGFNRLMRASAGVVGFSVNDFLLMFVIFPVISLFVVLWLIAMFVRSGKPGLELAVMSIPVIGFLYEKLFATQTYYRVDTMLMFQTAVHSAVMETIDNVTSQKGLRALSDDERKPVFSNLA